MRKIVSVVEIILCISLLLIGCGPKEKTEEEIKMDLSTHQDFMNGYDVEIEDFEVIKRQTNKKDKEDIIYVEVKAGNEELECNLSYKLEYGLYDSGWILDNVSESSDVEKQYIPRKEPAQELADIAAASWIEEGYMFTEKMVDIDNGTCIFYYEDLGKYELASTYGKISIPYTFDSRAGVWIEEEFDLEYEVRWDIEGIWFATYYERKNMFAPFSKEEGILYELAISELSEEGCHITVYGNGVFCKEFDMSLQSGDLFFDVESPYSGITHLIYIEYDRIHMNGDVDFEKVNY